jgi:hypothetical protein
VLDFLMRCRLPIANPNFFSVTAEAAGSSPVVPAIHSEALKNEWFFKLERTIQPTARLIDRRIYPTAERNSPCAARFVAVFLRIEIERRLDFAVTQGISSAAASSFNASAAFSK